MYEKCNDSLSTANNSNSAWNPSDDGRRRCDDNVSSKLAEHRMGLGRDWVCTQCQAEVWEKYPTDQTICEFCQEENEYFKSEL